MTAYTQQQYSALCSAIAQGVTKVKYGDKELEYRSLAEMRSIKTDMEKSLGLKTTERKRFIQFSKGIQ